MNKMKKAINYAWAALMLFTAACSKEPAEMGLTNETGGAHKLTRLSATLEETQSRTGLGTNQVVNWSNNDRIAVINLKTNTIYQ